MNRIPLDDAVSKADFHRLLREWIETTTEDQIGDAEFGQAAWLHVRDQGSAFQLNSDTKRQGVVEYLAVVDRHGDDVEWTIRPNRDGRNNAIAYGPERGIIQRFYHYVLP